MALNLMNRIHWLDPQAPEQPFPPVSCALRDPDGLLAAGGDLSTPRLLRAYRAGIFPWYEAGQPILWWSPDPRTILYPEDLNISRSLRKALRNRPYAVTFDTRFREVMQACAAPRPDQHGTWITPEMIEAYCALHVAGHAHSVEVADETGRLVGGLYGVAIGHVFFGESMFSRVRDGSKIALVWLACHLQHWGYALIDCQQATPHMLRMGAQGIPRETFSALLNEHCPRPGRAAPWQTAPALDVANWQPRGKAQLP